MDKKILIITLVLIGVSIFLLLINTGVIALAIPTGSTILGYTGRCWLNADIGSNYEVIYNHPTYCKPEQYPNGCKGYETCPYDYTPTWGSIRTACELGSCVNPCVDVNNCGHFCSGNQYFFNGKCENLEALRREYLPESYTDPKYAFIPFGCKSYEVITCGACEQCNAEVGCVAISPCCGNGVCETGENYPNCPTDCTNPCLSVTTNNYCLSSTQLVTNIQCNQITGAITYDLTTCNDNNLCTTDACQSNACVYTYTKPNNYCDDLIFNANPTCDTVTGEVTYDSTNCDDGNQCTINTCDESLGCLSQPKVIDCQPKCEDNTYYYNGLCNPITGSCSYDNNMTCTYGCNPITKVCNNEPVPTQNPIIQFFINIFNAIKGFFCNTFKLCF